MSVTKVSGGCLCGGVKYSLSTELNSFYFCHCEQCRKITGSAFAANILAKPAQIEWLEGAEKVRRFDYPGTKSFTKGVCSECGSWLPFLNESGETLYIPAGSLDENPSISPDLNIFWGDRAEWYEHGVLSPNCEGFP